MRVPLALVPMSFLVSLPILVLPTGPIGALGALAALALIAAALVGLRALLVAGTGLALVQYGLALYLRGGAVDWGGAAAFGVMLALTLDAADFGIRFRRAHVTPAALRAQLRSWVAIVIAGAAVCAAVVIAAAGGIGFRRLGTRRAAAIGAAASPARPEARAGPERAAAPDQRSARAGKIPRSSGEAARCRTRA
jgi:hypothetical protein